MRYLVKATVKTGRESALLEAIEAGTLGRGSVAGDEYLHNMRQARVDGDGVARWVETCFCATPLDEERPYWEEYFDLLDIRDAHSRRNCRDLNGQEPWACCECDCTTRLEKRIERCGISLLDLLRQRRQSTARSMQSSTNETAATLSNDMQRNRTKERI